MEIRSVLAPLTDKSAQPSLLDTRNGGTINRACTTLKNFPMELQLFDYRLEQVQWGERTGLDGKTLSLCVNDFQ